MSNEEEAVAVVVKDDKGEEKEKELQVKPVDEDSPVTFPQRLMEILTNPAYEDTIGWLPHGKGFILKDKKRFGNSVLPHFFKKSKFTSFTRKLNRWNFVRVTRGPETGAYYHPLFQRDNPKLCTQMTCISAKSSQNLQPMDPVALGLGTGGQLYPDFSDPAAVQRLQEQRQAFFQQQWQQQQAMMTAMMKKKEEEGDEDTKIEDAEGKGDDEKKDEEKGDDAAMAQQQQQYYAMFMAQQSHMAQMAGQMPNPQVQMAAFMSMPTNLMPGETKDGEEPKDDDDVKKEDESEGAKGDTSADNGGSAEV